MRLLWLFYSGVDLKYSVYYLLCRVVLNLCVSAVDLPVEEYLRANETFSTFLLTNSSLSPVTVDQLLKARLNLQVKYWL